MIRLLTATVVALALAASTATAATPKSLTVVATQTGGSHGTSTLTFRESLRSGAGTGSKLLGKDTIVCTHVTKSSMTCRGTFVLPAGNLIVAGTISFAKPVNTLAIVSGSGSYKGAKGRFSLRPLSSRVSTETFTFA